MKEITKAQAAQVEFDSQDSMILTLPENFQKVWYENGFIKFRIPVLFDPAIRDAIEAISHSQLTKMEQSQMIQAIESMLDDIALVRFIREAKNA